MQNGHDIYKQLEAYRESLGLMPKDMVDLLGIVSTDEAMATQLYRNYKSRGLPNKYHIKALELIQQNKAPSKTSSTTYSNPKQALLQQLLQNVVSQTDEDKLDDAIDLVRSLARMLRH